MASDVDMISDPEGVIDATNLNGLLIVRTTVGRVLARPVEDLGLRFAERDDETQPRRIDVDPSGKGIFVDDVPMTITRLRAVCAAD
jgi:hypothetical protein